VNVNLYNNAVLLSDAKFKQLTVDSQGSIL